MYNDGAGTRILTKELTVRTDAKITPEISVVSPTKTQTSVGFEISETDADNVGAITKIELVHKNGTVVADSLNQRTFANLLSNNAYTVKVTYVYNLNDGEGEHTVTKELAITTLAKATPEISVVSSTKTQTSVDFEISETDEDNVGAVTKIELVHKNGTVIADSLDQRNFANLLSNNAYTVKVTYVYNLNDGEGEHTVTKELAVTTDAKAAPSFIVKNESITTNGINAQYDITDVDNILSAYKVELYKGNTLVSENSDKKIDFTGLSYYTDYTVKITYTYDLNDGNENQVETYSYAFKTLPYIDVTECSIANTSAVSEGETIFMSVKLDNPLGMTIESVVVNGEIYNVTGASTKNKIFVEIVYNGQFAGGDTYLKIDKVNAKIDNTTLSVAPKTELSDNVFINGKLEVLKIEYVNDRFEPIDWSFPSDTVYVLITLNNPTGYNVDSIVKYNYPTITEYTVTDIRRLDDNRYYYVDDMSHGWNVEYLTKLYYSNDYIEKSLTYSEITARCYIVASDEIKYISNADELKNMNGGYYYELKNDIDLFGIEWLGTEFNGVFDGKGYSIKNMSFVGTVKNSDAYIGLFSYGTGIIQNVNIKEATVIVELIADDGRTYSAFVGGIIAIVHSEVETFMHIQGCAVDEYSIFTVKNAAGFVYAGGIAGCLSRSTIKNCASSGNISASSNSSCFAYAGGIAGYASDSTITNCTNSGDMSAGSLSGEACAGGIVGGASYDIITNCTNSGNISAVSSSYSAYSGGMAGNAYSDIIITNCTNRGSIYSSNRAGGIVGECSGGYVSNCTNSAHVSASATYTINTYAGGLIGFARGTTITNSCNSGSISASSTGNYASYSGGLVGYAFSGDSTVNITNSYNSGNVSTSDTNQAYSGGLIGSAELKITIEDSYNNSSVSATGKSARSGGLVGMGIHTITIIGSYNNGSVIAIGNYASSGGLVGYAGGVIITNSYNSGNVSTSDTTDQSYSGGLVGYTGDATITNSYNSGNVSLSTKDTSYASSGGLVGQVYHFGVVIITNSYNIGNVSATGQNAHSGGLVGRTEGTITITDSYNRGSVSTTGNYASYSAGLVGCVYDDKITITNSYNSGDVSASTTDTDQGYSGGLIGYAGGATIINSYSLVSGNNNYNGEPCTAEQLNSMEFYTQTLGWSEADWDFSELDVENGKYPKLKY